MKCSLLYILLFFYSSLPAFVTANRDLIIFCECGTNENIAKTYHHDNPTQIKGLGAASSAFLIALWQQAAPILVPEAFFKNIVDHKKLFDDFSNKPTVELISEYATYPFVNTLIKLQDFKNVCIYSKKSYLSIINDLYAARSLLELETRAQANVDYNWASRPRNFNEFELEVGKLLMCAFCPFDKYIIKKIRVKSEDQNLYLFIPIAYLMAHNLTLDTLGFNDIGTIVTATTLLEYNSSECYKAITKILPELFILNKRNDTLKIAAKKAELFKRPLPEQVNEADFLHFEEDMIKNRIVWALIISGHGNFNKVQDQDKLLILQAKREAALNDLKDALAYQATNPEKNYAGLIRIKQRAFDAIDAEVYPSKIAGMPLPFFKKVIKFFNDKVYTSMLFYSSCGAGGQNMIDPYKEITSDSPMNLSYPIAGGAITEAITYSRAPYIALPNYIKNISEKSLASVVDFPTKTIKINSVYNFKKYFTELHTEREKPISYTELFSLIDNFKSRKQTPSAAQIVNIPALRLPGLEWFSILDVDNSIMRISTVTERTAGMGIKVINKKALLIDALSIESTLFITAPLPLILSTAPGFTQHYLKKIVCIKSTLEEVVKSFFSPQVIYMSSKSFKIGTLVTSEGIFSNIEIFMNLNNENWFFTERHCIQWPVKKPIPPLIPQEKCCKAKRSELNTIFSARKRHQLPHKPSHFSGILYVTSSKEGKLIPEIEHISLKTLGSTLKTSYQKRIAKNLQESLTSLAESLARLAQEITT